MNRPVSVYVVMKETHSAFSYSSSHPHEVYVTRRLANIRCKELNEKASRNYYWVEKANML